MVTQEKTNHAEEEARAQLESIVEMVKRLEHCQQCNGEDCELTDAEVYAGINLYYKEGDKATDEERGEYHDEEAARQYILEDALDVEVRADWHEPSNIEVKPDEYLLLLCTGGPACRIIGELNDWQEPDRARIEYQDWFTPWIELVDITSEEHHALLVYAQQFYFGS